LWKPKGEFSHRALHSPTIASGKNAGVICQGEDMYFRGAKAGFGIRKRESTMRTRRRSSMNSLDTARTLHVHKIFLKINKLSVKTNYHE
jgi:hypothetical protein